jgi:hypothetical protein
VPDPENEGPLRALRDEVAELRRAREAGAQARLEETVSRLERLVNRLEELEVAGGADPVSRLRQQVGSRTVSRLREICDEPIPIMGPDLRVTAQGA